MMDLHVHSTCSDGSLTPQQLIQQAKTLGLRYFSITDHNNMDAYQQIQYEDTKDFILIPGVEMTCDYKGHTIDVLGYGVNPDIMEEYGLFEHILPEETMKIQQGYLSNLLDKCREVGLKTSVSLSIQSANERANDIICDDLLKYEENRRWLQQEGILNRTTFYRRHYLNPHSIFYQEEDTYIPSFATVTGAIRASGGLTFLAHPFVYDVQQPWAFLDDVCSTGAIDGVECIHRRHSSLDGEELITYCNMHNLYKSGGSDLHHEQHNLGFGDDGQQMIDETIAYDWLKRF